MFKLRKKLILFIFILLLSLLLCKSIYADDLDDEEYVYESLLYNDLQITFIYR